MAVGNIKGISIEIGGNTEPLQKALKGVNSTTRDLQGELKAVEKALKLDPTNAVLLQQKQKLLAESVTVTKDKLDTLKEAEKQAQTQFAKGEISESQYRALQREVIKTSSELENLESKAKESNATLEKVSEGVKKVGDASSKIVATGVVALGTAAVGTAVAGVLMGDELTKALNGVAAATGTGKEGMGEMEDIMLNIYNNNFGEDFTDIGKSIEEVAKQTGATGQELEDLTTNALMLRDTFEFEVTESTRAAKMMMDQFGISGTEAYTLIAQGAQSGLDKNGDLLDTINEYSPNFNRMGFSSEEMFNMLINGAESGTFSIDKLGDAVKEFEIRAKDGSNGTKDAFQSLGLDVEKTGQDFAEGGEKGKAAFGKVTEALFNIKDPMKQNEIGVALFGTQWEDLGAEGVKALVNIEGEASKSGETLEDINNIKYDSFGEGLEGIKRQLITGIALPVGEEVLPKLNDFSAELKDNIPSIVDSLTPVMEAIFAMFSKLADGIMFAKDNADIIIPILKTLLGAFISLGIINGVSKAVKTYSEAAKFATSAVKLLNIAKLKDISQTTILNGLYAKDAMSKGIKTITDLVKMSASLAIAKAKDIIQTTALNILYAKDAVVKGISTIAQIAHNVAVGAWNIICGIATGLTLAFGAAVAFLTSPIGLVILAIMALIGVGILIYKNWDVIKAKASELWENIKATFEGIKTSISTKVEEMKTAVTNKFTEIKTNVTNKVNEIKEGIANKFNEIKTNITNKVDEIKTNATNKFNEIKTGITTAINNAKESITTTFSNIKTSIDQKVNAIKGNVTNVFNSIKSAMTSPFETASGAIKTIIDKIKGFLSFQWKFPKLPMPHFKMSGSKSINPIDWIKQGVPKLGVEWYDKGGIFNSPQIIGVGEKRPEFVGALDDLKDIFREVMGEGKGTGAQINFNGSYSFNDKKDIDYFMNQSALLINRGKA